MHLKKVLIYLCVLLQQRQNSRNVYVAPHFRKQEYRLRNSMLKASEMENV